MKKKLDKFTAYALRVSGAKQVLSKRKGKWPKKLKLKAVGEAIKIAKVLPGIFNEVAMDPSGNGVNFCAIGCLGVVVGEPIKTSECHSGKELPRFKRSLHWQLGNRSFDGDGKNLLGKAVSKNDSGAGNSTVKALRWLKKQIEKT